jgi:hypothetical protein
MWKDEQGRAPVRVQMHLDGRLVHRLGVDIENLESFGSGTMILRSSRPGRMRVRLTDWLPGA